MEAGHWWRRGGDACQSQHGQMALRAAHLHAALDEACHGVISFSMRTAVWGGRPVFFSRRLSLSLLSAAPFPSFLPQSEINGGPREVERKSASDGGKCKLLHLKQAGAGVWRGAFPAKPPDYISDGVLEERAVIYIRRHACVRIGRPWNACRFKTVWWGSPYLRYELMTEHVLYQKHKYSRSRTTSDRFIEQLMLRQSANASQTNTFGLLFC